MLPTSPSRRREVYSLQRIKENFSGLKETRAQNTKPKSGDKYTKCWNTSPCLTLSSHSDPWQNLSSQIPSRQKGRIFSRESAPPKRPNENDSRSSSTRTDQLDYSEDWNRDPLLNISATTRLLDVWIKYFISNRQKQIEKITSRER